VKNTADSQFDDVCKTVLANCLRETTAGGSGGSTPSTSAAAVISVVPAPAKPGHRMPSGMCTFMGVGGGGVAGAGEPCRQRCISGYKFCIRFQLTPFPDLIYRSLYVWIGSGTFSTTLRHLTRRASTWRRLVPNAFLAWTPFLSSLTRSMVHYCTLYIRRCDHEKNFSSRFCATHSIMMGLRQPKTKKSKQQLTANQQQNVAFSTHPESSQNLLSPSLASSLSLPKTQNFDLSKPGGKACKRSSSTVPKGHLQQPPPPQNTITLQYPQAAGESMMVNGAREVFTYAMHSPSSGKRFMTNGPVSSSNYTTTVIYDEKNAQQFFLQQPSHPMDPGMVYQQQPGSNFQQDLSRPESQISVASSSVPYPANGTCGSPQSPWKHQQQYMRQAPGPPMIQQLLQQPRHSEISKSHPELASKLHQNAITAHHILAGSSAGAGYADFDESNTITLFNIPESSIIGPVNGGGQPHAPNSPSAFVMSSSSASIQAPGILSADETMLLGWFMLYCSTYFW